MPKSRKRRKKRSNFRVRQEPDQAPRRPTSSVTMWLAKGFVPSNYYYSDSGRPRLSRILFSIDSLSYFIILISGLSYVLLGIPDVKRIPEPARTVIGSIMIASATNRLIFISSLLRHRYTAVKFDPRYVNRFTSAMFISNMLSATGFTVCFLYYFGVIGFTATAIHAAWPFVSAQLSYTLSTILGWVASGVIGNYAFQFVRKKLEKN
jgi:hypothetical protein